MAGGGIKDSVSYGESDEIGQNTAVDNPPLSVTNHRSNGSFNMEMSKDLKIWTSDTIEMTPSPSNVDGTISRE